MTGSNAPCHIAPTGLPFDPLSCDFFWKATMMTTRITTTLSTTCGQHAQLGRTSTQATSPSLPLSSTPFSQTSAFQQHPPPTQRDPRLSLTPWTLASETSPPNVPPTMSLFLKPKDEHTARVICDLRPLNGLYPCNPPAFRLPSIGGLVPTTRGWPDCYFTKLDISAYVHSLSLSPSDLRRLCPPNMPTHPFVFHYKQQSWVWIRLPFGWIWAPALAQQQMTKLVSTALLAHPAVLGLVYYDDVLLACTDPRLLLLTVSPYWNGPSSSSPPTLTPCRSTSDDKLPQPCTASLAAQPHLHPFLHPLAVCLPLLPQA